MLLSEHAPRPWPELVAKGNIFWATNQPIASATTITCAIVAVAAAPHLDVAFELDLACNDCVAVKDNVDAAGWAVLY